MVDPQPGTARASESDVEPTRAHWGRTRLARRTEWPAFAMEVVDEQEILGAGNLSVTRYKLRVSRGELAREWITTNRSGATRFDFDDRAFELQIIEGADGSTEISLNPIAASTTPQPGATERGEPARTASRAPSRTCMHGAPIDDQGHTPCGWCDVPD